MCVHRAAIALPIELGIAPVSDLRGNLRRQILEDNEDTIPDWSTLRVIGPFERFNNAGQVVFEYEASVHCQSLQAFLREHCSA